jgi:hypothetical protein
MPDLDRDTLGRTLRTTDAWVVRSVCREFRDACPSRPASLASVVGTVDRCHLALRLGLDGARVGPAAARAGRLAVLQWADGRLACSRDACIAEAAAAGHLHVLEWIRSARRPIDWRWWTAAAVGCALGAVSACAVGAAPLVDGCGVAGLALALALHLQPPTRWCDDVEWCATAPPHVAWWAADREDDVVLEWD